MKKKTKNILPFNQKTEFLAAVSSRKTLFLVQKTGNWTNEEQKPWREPANGISDIIIFKGGAFGQAERAFFRFLWGKNRIKTTAFCWNQVYLSQIFRKYS
jgi:hypothetical protein